MGELNMSYEMKIVLATIIDMFYPKLDTETAMVQTENLVERTTGLTIGEFVNKIKQEIEQEQHENTRPS